MVIGFGGRPRPVPPFGLVGKPGTCPGTPCRPRRTTGSHWRRAADQVTPHSARNSARRRRALLLPHQSLHHHHKILGVACRRGLPIAQGRYRRGRQNCALFRERIMRKPDRRSASPPHYPAGGCSLGSPVQHEFLCKHSSTIPQSRISSFRKYSFSVALLEPILELLPGSGHDFWNRTRALFVRNYRGENEEAKCEFE